MTGVPEWWSRALAEGDYLQALALLRRAVDESAPVNFDPVAYLLQAMGRFADADAVRHRRTELERPLGLDALPRELQEALRMAAEVRPPDSPVISPDGAIGVLRQAVKSRRVVILGEEHHQPEHRAFGARILPVLRAVGITHLALEAGNQANLDKARESKRVTPTTDGFSFEPQRAALLRAALAIDLPIVAFDVDAEDVLWMQGNPAQAMAFRERRMAEHIVDRILAPEPDARVMVWVGYGHAQKVEIGVKMMALHLWEMTGEEPFCAYQLTGPGSRPGVDLVIRHPEARYEHGRPDWLRLNRHSVQGEVEPPGEYLVQLLPADEGATSTPVDQLLTGADGQFELLVANGDYLLRVWRGEGDKSKPRGIVITRSRKSVQITYTSSMPPPAR